MQHSNKLPWGFFFSFPCNFNTVKLLEEKSRDTGINQCCQKSSGNSWCFGGLYAEWQQTPLKTTEAACRPEAALRQAEENLNTKNDGGHFPRGPTQIGI